MPYYMQGDYYRGDPGFFGFLGGLAKKAVGFIPGVGPALSAGLEAVTRRGASNAIVPAARGGIGGMMKRGVGIIKKHPVLSAAGAAGAVAGGAMLGTKRGRRLIGMGGERKRRRMNVCNARALRRAIRRSAGFAKLAKRVLHFTQPRPPKGRAYFRPKKRKRI